MKRIVLLVLVLVAACDHFEGFRLSADCGAYDCHEVLRTVAATNSSPDWVCEWPAKNVAIDAPSYDSPTLACRDWSKMVDVVGFSSGKQLTIQVHAVSGGPTLRTPGRDTAELLAGQVSDLLGAGRVRVEPVSP